MAGLQRSVETFRRSGSSGLVWEDRFLSNDLNSNKNKDEEAADSREVRHSQGVVVMERSRSNGGRGYRTGRVSPALDPPSPKLSVCGFCGIFGKPEPAKKSKPGRR